MTTSKKPFDGSKSSRKKKGSSRHKQPKPTLAWERQPYLQAADLADPEIMLY